MTTPTFNTQQLDIPETAVADRDAAPRESRNGRIDTARFWVGAALTAGISAMVALIALIITNDLLHIPVMINEGGRLVMIGFGAYALFAAAAGRCGLRAVRGTGELRAPARPLLRLDRRPRHTIGRAASPYHRSSNGRSARLGGDQPGRRLGDHRSRAGGGRPLALTENDRARLTLEDKGQTRTILEGSRQMRGRRRQISTGATPGRAGRAVQHPNQ